LSQRTPEAYRHFNQPAEILCLAINFLNLSPEVRTDTLDMKNKGKIETDLTMTNMEGTA
jgi:hypothetical protein